MTEANLELINIHKKNQVENNFIMKAYKKQIKQDQGITESSQESSIDSAIYQQEISKI